MAKVLECVEKNWDVRNLHLLRGNETITKNFMLQVCREIYYEIVVLET